MQVSFFKNNLCFFLSRNKNFSRQDPVFSDLKIKVLKYNKKQHIPLFFTHIKLKKGILF